MSFFNTTEKKVAEKLINAGFEKAAQSFSSIAKQEVNIEMTDVDVAREWSKNNHKPKYQGELTLLTTEIMGELGGKSYLIFTPGECDTLYKACFPHNGQNNRGLLEEAFLKELDNILSASVITEFSNFLQVEIYGDVPGFCRDSSVVIEQLIEQDFTEDVQNHDSIFLIANTKFLFKDNLQLRPQFFWKFSDGFISMIKKVASN